jgi:RHS repeat-associated protein
VTVVPVPLFGAGVPTAAAATPPLVTYFHADHLGSAVVLTDAAGQLLRRVVYQPFGAAVSQSGPWQPPEYGFTGQRFEAGVALYDYGARWYDPALGRFLQPDPVVSEPFDPQALHPYAYVRNDPLGRIDPLGLASSDSCASDPLGCEGGGGGGGGGSSGGGGSPPPVYPFPRDGRGPDYGNLIHPIPWAAAPVSPLRSPGVVTPEQAGSLGGAGSERHVPVLQLQDLEPGDVLLTGDQGLAQVLHGLGDYGHAAIVLGVSGDRLNVLSSDLQGRYVRDNAYTGVGGRWFDVFRVQGIRVDDLLAYAENLYTEGGLSQYVGTGERGANLCSCVVADALWAAGGPHITSAAQGVITPNGLAIVLGPPIGRVFVPLVKESP